MSGVKLAEAMALQLQCSTEAWCSADLLGCLQVPAMQMVVLPMGQQPLRMLAPSRQQQPRLNRTPWAPAVLAGTPSAGCRLWPAARGLTWW